MIRGALHDPGTKEPRFGGIEVVDDWSPSAEGWLWLDIHEEPGDTVRQLLRDRFGIDELAIRDAFRERHPPKLEDFENYVFLLARGLDAKTRDINYNTIQLAFFFGANFLLTYRFRESLSIDRTWKEVQAGETSMRGGPVHIACKIMRAVVDRYTPILLNLEKRLEQLEDEIFTVADDGALEELVDYNGRLKKMRRTLTYHCNVYIQLEHLPQIASHKNLRHEVHDVFEQFDRLKTLSDLFQELVVDLMNGYLSISSHRLNQIMKVLTVFTVIFLPLTLMVGIYGMNFDYMSELHWRFGYFGLLGSMIAVVVGAFGFFKWKRGL